MEFEFIFPYPPATNTLYSNNKFGRRILSNAGKNYKMTVHRKAIDVLGLHTFDKSTIFTMYIELYSSFYNKSNGEVKRTDVDGRTKALQDGLYDAIGTDDKHVFVQNVHKCHFTGEPFVYIRLEPMLKEVPCAYKGVLGEADGVGAEKT